MKLVDGIISSVNAAVAVKLYLTLSGQGFDPVLSLVVSVVISMMAAKLLEYLILDFPKLFYICRKITMDGSSFEGVWLMKIDADQNLVDDVFYHYAVANIFYNTSDGKYHYEGSAYDKDCERKGDWYSTALTTEASTSTVRYFYDGKIYIDGVEKVEGIGTLKFERDASGKFNRATDIFIELNKEVGRYSCFLKKINKKELKKYKLNGSFDKKELIKNYENF